MPTSIKNFSEAIIPLQH